MNRKQWRQKQKGNTEAIASLYDYQDVVDDVNKYINELHKEFPIDETEDGQTYTQLSIGDKFTSHQGTSSGKVYAIEEIYQDRGAVLISRHKGRGVATVEREVSIRLLRDESVFTPYMEPETREEYTPAMGDCYRSMAYNEQVYMITEMEAYSYDSGYNSMRYTLTAVQALQQPGLLRSIASSLNDEREWVRVVDTSQESIRHIRSNRFF